MEEYFLLARLKQGIRILTMKAEKASNSLYIRNMDIYVSADEKCSVLDVLLKNQIEMGHSCEGMASCTTCKVYICHGLDLLEAPKGEELERAQERKFSKEERLSCQIPAKPGLVLDV